MGTKIGVSWLSQKLSIFLLVLCYFICTETTLHLTAKMKGVCCNKIRLLGTAYLCGDPQLTRRRLGVI